MKIIVSHKLEHIDDHLYLVNPSSIGFFGGKIGLANYFFQNYLVFGNRKAFKRANSLVQEVIQQVLDLEIQTIGSSFSEGVAGIGYLLSIFEKDKLLTSSPKEVQDKIEEFLFEEIYRLISERRLDYIYGASGVMYYFLERLPSAKRKNLLSSCVEALSNVATRDEMGIRFLSPKDSSGGKEYINFSLSHGLTGILLVLTQIYKKGIQVELIEELILGGIEYMLNFKGQVNFKDEKFSFFPFAINNDTGIPIFGQRLGWCYGDLNQAILLYKAGEIFRNSNFKKLGDLIGTQTLMRKDKESTEVEDIFFCHGSSGLAHIYKALFMTTGIDSYYQGYEYWLEQTLISLYEIPDFQDFTIDFLEGLGGVALTLLSYVSRRELDWEKTLLL